MSDQPEQTPSFDDDAAEAGMLEDDLFDPAPHPSEQAEKRCGGLGLVGSPQAPCPGCPDCQGERCPTCKSGDPAKKWDGTVFKFTPYGSCPDPFHSQPPSDERYETTVHDKRTGHPVSGRDGDYITLAERAAADRDRLRAERDSIRDAALALVEGLRKQFPKDVALAKAAAALSQPSDSGDSDE